MNDGDLSLKAGGQVISGWTSVRVTAGIERFPRDFNIAMTERFPGEFAPISIAPGQPCEIFIGADRVITGYVDRYLPAIAPRQHSIQVTGRGMCEDAIDCSAEWPSNQILSAPAVSIARKLVAPLGITVDQLGPALGPIEQTNLLWGERVYEVIERIARSQALLVYESADGHLVLAPVGSGEHASGFRQGENVERATGFWTVDQRYSEYDARTASISLALPGNDVVETIGDQDMEALRRADGQPRRRLLDLIADQGDAADFELLKKRALWEAARRAGRSFNVQLVADSWRDEAGTLWMPNWYAPVQLPSLKLPDHRWVIGEVSYVRDAQGTRAEVTMMPPEAFRPQPFRLLPLLPLGPPPQ